MSRRSEYREWLPVRRLRFIRRIRLFVTFAIRWTLGMRVFVTGGNGFIGSALVRQLLARGDEVVALVRTINHAKRLMDLGVRPVAGDILQPGSYRRLMAGADIVF